MRACDSAGARSGKEEHPGIYFLASCMIHPFRFIDIAIRRSAKKVVSRVESRPPRALLRLVIEALGRAICRARGFLLFRSDPRR